MRTIEEIVDAIVNNTMQYAYELEYGIDDAKSKEIASNKTKLIEELKATLPTRKQIEEVFEMLWQDGNLSWIEIERKRVEVALNKLYGCNNES